MLPSKSANGIKFPLSRDATLFVSFLESKTPKATGVLLGPHPIEVQVSSACANPRFWIRFVGDALVFVRMEQAADKTQWVGEVTFPKPGSYTLEGRWYGCKGDEMTWAPFEGNTLSIQTMNQSGETASSGAHQGIFAKGAWIYTKSIRFNDVSLHPFMWMSPTVKPDVGSFIKINDNRLIAKDGVVLPNTNFFDFNSLSNYELVWYVSYHRESIIPLFKSAYSRCIMLCTSMAVLWEARRPRKFEKSFLPYDLPSFPVKGLSNFIITASTTSYNPTEAGTTRKSEDSANVNIF